MIRNAPSNATSRASAARAASQHASSITPMQRAASARAATAVGPAPGSTASRRDVFAAQARVASPLGPMLIAATSNGVAGMWFDGDVKHHPGPIDAPMNDAHPHVARARRWLDEYWRGHEPRTELRLDPQGTSFQQAVWRELVKIRRGAFETYGAIAHAVGAPQASRAVGAAVGRNPLAIVVPCHRVIGKDGSLTGYAAGLHRKRALLVLEGYDAVKDLLD